MIYDLFYWVYSDNDIHNRVDLLHLDLDKLDKEGSLFINNKVKLF